MENGMCQKWGCHHENQQEILQEDLELHRKWMFFSANTGFQQYPLVIRASWESHDKWWYMEVYSWENLRTIWMVEIQLPHDWFPEAISERKNPRIVRYAVAGSIQIPSSSIRLLKIGYCSPKSSGSSRYSHTCSMIKWPFCGYPVFFPILVAIGWSRMF